MKLKQSVINTFERVGIEYEPLVDKTEKVTVANRFSGEECETTPLVATLIAWVYHTSNEYEKGIMEVKIADFDRIRYFVAEIDTNAYRVCLD